MESETLEDLAKRISTDHPEVSQGVVHRIAVEEHALLSGLQPDEVTSEVVIEATEERIDRLDSQRAT